MINYRCLKSLGEFGAALEAALRALRTAGDGEGYFAVCREALGRHVADWHKIPEFLPHYSQEAIAVARLADRAGDDALRDILRDGAVEAECCMRGEAGPHEADWRYAFIYLAGAEWALMRFACVAAELDALALSRGDHGPLAAIWLAVAIAAVSPQDTVFVAGALSDVSALLASGTSYLAPFGELLTRANELNENKWS